MEIVQINGVTSIAGLEIGDDACESSAITAYVDEGVRALATGEDVGACVSEDGVIAVTA